MSSFRSAPRKGENFELAADLNSEYKEKRKDAIKRVIANMTVQKGMSLHAVRLIKMDLRLTFLSKVLSRTKIDVESLHKVMNLEK